MTSDNGAPTSPAYMGIPAGLLMAGGLILAGIATILWLTWDNVTSMVSVWSRISAYNHCWMILPIALFLAWERRYRLAGLPLQPFWPGIVLLAGFVIAWIVARGAAIMEGQQFAIIGMIQALLLVILGRKIFRAQIFPILYLLLLVPSGGVLLPFLQTVAAKITVILLSLTSIPVYAEQLYIQAPVGLFYVAPGCSGLNFILAALALSMVYADLMYKGWRRKLACVGVWVAVAVLANGIRIFAIIVLAQITDKKLAIVDDHILYGWGFFIIILFGLMWAGKHFANLIHDEPAEPVRILPATAASAALLGAGITALLVIGIPIGYVHSALAAGEAKRGLTIDMPQILGQSRLTGKGELWPQAFQTADLAGLWQYQRNSGTVDLAIGYFWDQWEGHEAASEMNFAAGPESAQVIRRNSVTVELNGAPRILNALAIRSGMREYLVWNWYCAGNHMTKNPFQVQLRTAFEKLRLRDGPAAIFTLLTPDGSDAEQLLKSFLLDLAASGELLSIRQPGTGAARAAVCW